MFVQLVFSFGLTFCKLLQKDQFDLKEAVTLAEYIIKVLKKIRINCNTEFHKLFLLANVSVLKELS
jgi:hypothetical protein